jgi:chlorite dismutase
MQSVPEVVRKAAMKGVETFARSKGIQVIDPKVVAQAAEAREKGELQTPPEPGSAPQSADKKAVRRQYVSFMFYKMDPAWRRLPQAEREQGKKEFTTVVDHYTSEKKLMVLSYSTVGTRGDCDFMMWRISYSLETIQEFSGKLLATHLGKYLHTPYAYLAMTKRSVYVDKLNPEHEEQRLRIVPGKAKYLFIYPFVKTPEWYLLTKYARQGMMDEHIMVGSKYPSVKLNTTYSFGLDDQEFVVAFESDKPEDFLDLVMELRETQGRLYTLRDTPIFTCISKTPQECLDLLGG